MAPDVDDIVHDHRDGARRSPQVHRPDAAAFRLARGIGHVTPLLQIQAPHGPLGSGEVELSCVVGRLNTLVMGSGRNGEAIQVHRRATTPRPPIIHRKGCLLLGPLTQPSAR